MKRKYIILFLLPFSLFLLSTQSLGAEGEMEETAMGFIGAETCQECHEDTYASYARSIHSRKVIKGPASQNACETCHGAGAEHVEKGGGRDVAIFTFDDDVDPAAKAAKCLSCHRQNTDMDSWEIGVHARNEISCDSCHDMHADTSQRASEPEVCFGCHQSVRVEVNKRSHHPIIEGKVSCSSCHQPHGSITESGLKTAGSQELCYECHADKRGPYIYDHPPVEEDCMICHTPHGSRHSRLMKEKVPNICQDCHDWSRHPGTPYDNEAGFAGSGPSNRFFARSCLNCHGTIHGSNTFENHRFTR